MINKDFLMGYGAGKASGGGGSENPNRVQVITGTVGHPWGDFTNDEISELQIALSNGNASAVLTFTDNENEYSNILYSASPDDVAIFGFCKPAIDAVLELMLAPYNTGLSGALYFDSSGERDFSENIVNVPSTITIYWHPMPQPQDSQ